MRTKTKIYGWQEDLVSLIPQPAGALFAEAGKGKTLMGLTYFLESDASKLLILCPNAKIVEWVADVEDEVGIKAIGLNQGTAKNKVAIEEKADAYVIRYENTIPIRNELRKMIDDDWMIILDESHSIKNMSKSSRAVLALGKKTPHKILLTATPQSKGWVDYLNQMKFLGVIDISLTTFKNTYCILQHMEMGGRMFSNITGYNSNIESFKELVHDHSIYYFPGEEVEVIDEIIPIPKHESYDHMRKNRVYDRVRAGYSGVLHQYLKQLSSGVFNDKVVHTYKIDALRKVLNKHTEEDVTIFYYLDSELNIIIDLCKELDREYYQHNGSVKDARDYMLSDKRSNAVVLVQYQAGGTGLNWLVRSHTAWFHSLPDRHLPFIQARKRLDRIGQNHSCTFYIPITTGTIERDNYNTIVEGLDFDEKRVNEALSKLD